MKHFQGKQYRPKREKSIWDGTFRLNMMHFQGKQYRPKHEKFIWDGIDRITSVCHYEAPTKDYSGKSVPSFSEETEKSVFVHF